jgi:hypothetical protein
MRVLLFAVLHAVLLACLIPSALIYAQSPPADFKVVASTGGLAPWDEKARLTIDNSGQAHYVRYTTANPPAVLLDTTFTVDGSNLQQLWKTIQDSSFFSINPTWADSMAHDGMYAKITVTANGVTHQVSLRNAWQSAIQTIIQTLNTTIPTNVQLQYIPPDTTGYVPKDPCLTLFGARGTAPTNAPRLETSPDPKVRAFPGPYLSKILSAPPSDASHPGSVAACNVTLQDAVANGWASVSSKGDFFGDDVSITVNNQNHPPCNTVEVTLYLEFWGPLAEDFRINSICQDIAKKWAGAKTTDGRNVEISFVTRKNSGATSAPNTPGFHEIQLVPKGTVRSHVTGGPDINAGVGGGIWEVPQPVGTYAHEAGHLMGLPDRYQDYNKQADGSWVNAKTGQSYANDDAFANYLTAKYPGQTAAQIKNNIMNTDVWSVPVDGSENDLMADVGKPLRQADIDLIAANPGLLVSVQAGSVFGNRNRGDQNLVVTHADEVYAGPGQSRTLNGIYAACIDHSKGIPGQGGIFDVAPPLEQWKGIEAASYLARLVRYADSAGLYCDFNIKTQEAIWRISDNAPPAFSTAAVQLLADAGIELGSRFLDFPRLEGTRSNDPGSHTFVPTQLYLANIQPAFSTGQVNVPTSLHAGVATPSGSPAVTGYTWTATGPDGLPASITGSDSTAALTPTRSGVYEVALQISVSDSVNGQLSFASGRKGYVIVPDAYTETFEHPGLTDKYPWKSYGDAPWIISSINPETGSYSAQPGGREPGIASTLGIEVNLPADSVIAFSVRTYAGGFFDGVDFSIDSVSQESFGGGTDWTVQKFPVRAGKHLLTWKFSSFSSDTTYTAWLDNIFFPGDVVVTSVMDQTPDVPKVFALEQNYPNPFNPKTEVRFQVPGASDVNITVYDMLGRKVAVLVNERKLPGRYEVTFDGSRLASGTYFYRMAAGDFVQTRKLILLK